MERSSAEHLAIALRRSFVDDEIAIKRVSFFCSLFSKRFMRSVDKKVEKLLRETR